MPLNKFGASLNRGDNCAAPRRPSLDSIRSYVRDNALCLNQLGYDARERKIRRVASPEIDTDATNKRYVVTSLRDVREENRAFRDDTTNAITQLKSDLQSDVTNRVDFVTKTFATLIGILEDQIKDSNTERQQLKETIDKLREDVTTLRLKLDQAISEQHKRPSTRSRPTHKDKDSDRGGKDSTQDKTTKHQ